ncbi:DUF397 domain-containing protein [Streptomyces sp. NPDC048717]|uniref:DUF397 domain-containing protein n=1 Tax=Streptomyces sp. NPDC048717 TaxID=3154928 RepID=UPI00344ADAFE
MTINSGSFPATQLGGAVWTKSSYSGSSQSQCVEVGNLAGTPFAGLKAVRDSKRPNGPALLFSQSVFAGFIADVENGKFGA